MNNAMQVKMQQTLLIQHHRNRIPSFSSCSWLSSWRQISRSLLCYEGSCRTNKTLHTALLIFHEMVGNGIRSSILGHKSSQEGEKHRVRFDHLGGTTQERHAGIQLLGTKKLNKNQLLSPERSKVCPNRGVGTQRVSNHLLHTSLSLTQQLLHWHALPLLFRHCPALSPQRVPLPGQISAGNPQPSIAHGRVAC